MARVHAVTIHHRGREMLDVCLQTLLASTAVELDIVVVLNGCDEELPEVAQTSPRVHVTSAGEPVGFSAANNLGVAWASANLGEPDYYYFINNDTRSEPDSLMLLVAALDNDERAAAAGPTLIIDWAPEYLNSLCLNVTEDAWAWDEGIGIRLADYGPLPERRRVVAVTGSAILVDAAVHRRVGGWTELYDYYFEDIDLCLKIRDAGYEVIHEPAAVVGHHVSATMTLESDYKYFLFWRNRLVLAMVHWPLGLLARLFRVAVVEEILRRPRAENGLQRRAMRGALKKLPRSLAARWRNRGARSWTALLVPRGSVPVITLPERLVVDESGAGAQKWSSPSSWDEARRLAAPAADGRRVLVLGCSPLPFENQRMNLAPGARTWQFARSLAGDGHAVCVVAMRIPGAYEADSGTVDRIGEAGVVIYSVPFDDFRRPGVVDAVAEAFRPDVIVGASSAVPALRAVEIAGDRPVWVDLFGDLMAEAQARLDVLPDEELLPYRDVLVSLLERGDAFSAVSDRQRFSVMGQLGLVGRLNRASLGAEMVHTVPCCVVDGMPRAEGGPLPPVLPELGESDFVVLWGGGFNTWCDVDTLLDGVERAMSAADSIRLVVTGGPIRGHDDLTYRRFLDRVAGSPFRDRLVVKGQLEAELASSYLRRADLGVVTEKKLAERSLGSSGRVLRWLGEGLPLVCTDVSELGATLAARDLASIYRVGDADDLARAILEAASNPDQARERAERGRRFALANWSIEATTGPVRRWVEECRKAPDAGTDNPLTVGSPIDAARRLAETRAELERERIRYHQLRSELGNIHQSKMWKIWMLYIGLLNAVRPRAERRKAAPDDEAGP